VRSGIRSNCCVSSSCSASSRSAPSSREGVLEGFLLAAELGDPLRDQLRLDPPLEGGYLGLDLAVQFGDLLADPRACELAVAAPLAVVGAQLLVESGAWPAQQRTMPENK
jgi:hypothetical protein